VILPVVKWKQMYDFKEWTIMLTEERGNKNCNTCAMILGNYIHFHMRRKIRILIMSHAEFFWRKKIIWLCFKHFESSFSKSIFWFEFSIESLQCDLWHDERREHRSIDKQREFNFEIVVLNVKLKYYCNTGLGKSCLLFLYIDHDQFLAWIDKCQTKVK